MPRSVLSTARVTALFAGFLVLTFLSPASGQTPEKFNLKSARRGVVLIKAFTPGFDAGIGSGFLVSKDGLIYTCRHVVAPPDENIRGTVILVGVPSPKDPDKLDYFRAEVVPSVEKGKNLDFAVLKIAAKDAGRFEPLGLSFDKLDLGDDVAALGYPVVKDDSPGLSFNKGSISGTRVQFDRVSYYQTDAAVNPGNSGGPLVNVKGEAVGIVTLKKRGADSIGFAMQLSEAKAAIENAMAKAKDIKPDAGPTELAKLPIPRAIGSTKNDWTITRGTIKETKGILIVDNDGSDFGMTSKDALPENFQLTIRGAVDMLQGKQVLQPSQRNILRTVVVRFACDDTEAGVLERKGQRVHWSASQMLVYKDADVIERKQVGNPEEPFSMTIVKQGRAMTVSVNGEMLVRLLDDKPLKGGQKFSIGGYLSRLYIRDISVVALDDKTPAGLTGFKDVVAKAPSTGPGPGSTRPRPMKEPAPKTPEAPELSGDRTEVTLSSAADQFCVGGNGRYVVLRLPKERKLAIFDASAGKIVKYLPVAEDNAQIAAGVDKVLIGLPDSSAVQRYDFATFEKELTAPVALKKGAILQMLMGSASRGPLVMIAGDEHDKSLHFFDTATLKPIEYKEEKGPRPFGWRLPGDYHARISADGTMFTWWGDGSPGGFNILKIGPDSLSHTGAGKTYGHLTPSPDARVIYTGRGAFTPEGKPLNGAGEGPNSENYMVPALQGRFFLRVPTGKFPYREKSKGPITLHIEGDARPLAALKDVQIPSEVNPWDREKIAADMRLILVPSSKLLIVIPSTNDRLVLYKLDINAAIETSGIDYLFVTSSPVTTATPGAAYTYEIAVKAKKGGVKFKLETGPEGMKVDAAGRLLWTVPSGFSGKKADVLLTISDAAGQEIFHSFQIAVE